MKAKQSPGVPAAHSSLQVIEIDPQTDSRWEALMTSIPTSWMYYHPVWLQAMQEAYDYKPVHLACEDLSGQLVGILPLFYRRGWRTGRSLRSGFIGPLAYDDQASAALVQAAVERSRAQTGVQMHVKVLSNAIDSLLEGVVGVPAHETYLLTLPQRADLLHLEAPLKRAINKATREGVQVRPAQTEHELRAWYQLYVQTMHRLMVLPQPYRLFERAWHHLHPQGRMRLLLAERSEAGQRKLLAGFLYLLWGQTISFDSAGWREEEQAVRPNDLLHWQAIQDACTEGFRWYDFGDVPLGNQGLARYKSKWGAQAKMVYDYSYPPSQEAASSTYDQSERSVQRLVRAAWQRLPPKTIGLLSNWYYALHLY